MLKKAAAITLGLAALVLNPFFACSTGTKKVYSFGADEMRAAIEGTWTITVPAGGPDTPAVEYTVTIAQSDKASRSAARAAPSLVAPAAACDQRSLVKSAAACIDSTEMPLDVQIVKGPSTTSPKGELKVYGYSFRDSHLTLDLGADHVSAQVSPDGVASKVGMMVGRENQERAGAMTRVSARARGHAGAAPAPSGFAGLESQ